MRKCNTGLQWLHYFNLQRRVISWHIHDHDTYCDDATILFCRHRGQRGIRITLCWLDVARYLFHIILFISYLPVLNRYWKNLNIACLHFLEWCNKPPPSLSYSVCVNNLLHNTSSKHKFSQNNAQAEHKNWCTKKYILKHTKEIMQQLFS